MQCYLLMSYPILPASSFQYDILSRDEYTFQEGDSQTYDLFHPQWLMAVKRVLPIARAGLSSEEINNQGLVIDVFTNQGRCVSWSKAAIQEFSLIVKDGLQYALNDLQVSQLRLSRFMDYYTDELVRTDKGVERYICL